MLAPPRGASATQCFAQFCRFRSCVDGVQPDEAPVQVSLRKMPEELEEEAGSRFVASERNVM